MALPAYKTPAQHVWHWTFRAICVLVFLFLLTPLIAIVPLSFSSGAYLVYPLPGFSLRWYADFFGSGAWQLAIQNTFIVATSTALLSTLLGTMAAMGLSRSDFPGRGLVMALVISPMVVPFIITALGMFFFFAQLGIASSLFGLILAHTALGVPFVVITVSATLQGYDMNLTRAAASLGAPPLYGFRKVTLPIIGPGVISGALFAFAISFDEVVVTIFLAGPAQRTLPRQMFSGIRENLDPTIAAVATFMMLVSILLLLVVELLRRRSERLRGLR